METDILETPMCEDHPNIPAEVLCIKHRQFVCMTCVVEERKHATRKCDSKPIRNLKSKTEKKLVSLLAMKTVIMEKKIGLEKHIADTDEKKMEVKGMIENFMVEIKEELQKKLEFTLQSADNKSNVIQDINRRKMVNIDAVNSLFDAEIDRLTNKKSKEATECEGDIQALREKALNLPSVGLRISHGFTPNKAVKEVLHQLASLGEVLLEEDDEMYEQIPDDKYPKPKPAKSQSSLKDTTIKQKTPYEELRFKKADSVEYSQLETNVTNREYRNIVEVKSNPGKTKPTGPTCNPQPPPETPYVNTSKQEDLKTKLPTFKGSSEKMENYYKNQVVLRDTQRMTQSTTRPESKSFSKNISGSKTAPGSLHAVEKQAGRQSQSKELTKRSNSLLEKYFGENDKVMQANAAQKSPATVEITNKPVKLSSSGGVKRRITELIMLGSNRLVLLDVLNSVVLLVKADGEVISEQNGEGFTHVVGNGRDTFAVLGRGRSPQISIYMAHGERKLEEQSCIKLHVESTVAEVTGFDFDKDAGEYAISGHDRVVVLSDSGKTKRSLSFSKCLPGKQNAKNIRATYEFQTNSVYILNTNTGYVKRFDFGKGQTKWESKLENGRFMPSEIVKGSKMIYVSFHDCIKAVAMENGEIVKSVKTKTVLDDILGLFINEEKGIVVVSSASDSSEGSNKFAIVGLS